MCPAVLHRLCIPYAGLPSVVRFVQPFPSNAVPYWHALAATWFLLQVPSTMALQPFLSLPDYLPACCGSSLRIPLLQRHGRSTLQLPTATPPLCASTRYHTFSFTVTLPGTTTPAFVGLPLPRFATAFYCIGHPTLGAGSHLLGSTAALPLLPAGGLSAASAHLATCWFRTAFLLKHIPMPFCRGYRLPAWTHYACRVLPPGTGWV